jgi:hypothetical protein
MEVSCAKRFRVTRDELDDGITVGVSNLTTVDELYEIMHNRIYECFKHYNLKHYDIGLWVKVNINFDIVKNIYQRI